MKAGEAFENFFPVRDWNSGPVVFDHHDWMSLPFKNFYVNDAATIIVRNGIGQQVAKQFFSKRLLRRSDDALRPARAH